jgi:hypothetical protein
VAADWSQTEVEAVVTDYFVMLVKELQKEPYNKTAHRNALATHLSNRSDGSIERKHQNISAILIGIGYPYISGYKPLGNYQQLLGVVVVSRAATDQELAAIVEQAVRKPAEVPPVKDVLAALEKPPVGKPFGYGPAAESSLRPLVLPPVNYLEREARNGSLGRAGEEFVLSFERARLIQAGAGQLAHQVEHVAVTQGDGLGFDIRSFEPNGKDRLIEVKTTAYGKETPFFVSRHEVAVSAARTDHYHLMRVFEFRDTPRLYALKGSLMDACLLQPVQFSARPK